MQRTIFDKYIDFIKLDLLDLEIVTIINDLRAFYQVFPMKNEIVLEEFTTWFFHVRHVNLQESNVSLFKLLFKKLSETNVELAEKVIKHFQELTTKNQIISTLEDEFDIEELRDLLNKHEALVGKLNEDEGWIPNNLDRLMISTAREGGLRFKLDCLSKSLNNLIKGDFGIIAAYVDTGKTTLAISEATHMAQQIHNGRILWLNNEEYNDRVIKKLWQATLNTTWDKIQLHKNKAEQAYVKKMHGDIERIKFVDIRGYSISQIQTLFKHNKPRLAIIDQIDKIGIKSEKFWGEHDRLKKLYGEIRALASTYCPIIGISQADASTRWRDKKTQEVVYQRYIDQSQLDGSKVGKPGEADFIITIGKDADCPNSRFIHVSKNKMDGIDDSYRQIKAEVIFNGECSRYENPK